MSRDHVYSFSLKIDNYLPVAQGQHWGVFSFEKHRYFSKHRRKMLRIIFRIYILLCIVQIVISMNQKERDWGPNPTVFNIGGVLSNSESERYFNETISVSKQYFLTVIIFSSY